MFNRFLLTVPILILIFSVDSLSQIYIPKSLGSYAIGKYTAGCVKNSVELPVNGFGYQVIRTKRRRNFGHKNLVNFITNLTDTIKYKYSARLLIADMAQRGGGPMLDQHNSHQTGLDADILYLHRGNGNNITLKFNERQRVGPKSVLNYNKTRVDDSKWSWINGEILKEAALMSEVDRIFVNPAIKKRLCKKYNDEEWQKKIRPWWGHDGHFHVRLKCPDDSPKCVANLPLPDGIGCGAKVDWWFSKEAYIERAKKRTKSPKTKKDLILPRECR